jgi:class 3 adenylate cyclase
MRSSRNPSLCNRCNTHVVEGRIIEITVLFADLSSFTELTHELGPERTHEVVDRFLKMATAVLVRHDAFIDKYLGDGVMAFFNVPIQREDHAGQAVLAALEIQAGLPALKEQGGVELKAGVGIACGWARVGRLGSGDARDYTAVGDVVNLASRLEGHAGPGAIVMDQCAYGKVAGDFPGASPEQLMVKGFPDLVHAYRLGAKAGIEPQIPYHIHRGERGPGQAVGVGSVVFAILGAPCAVFTLLSPWAVALGIGGLFGATSVLWVFDQDPLRGLLLVLATLGASANLYAVWHAGKLRRRMQGGERATPMSPLDRRRTLLVSGASVLTIVIVVFEVVAHRMYHS